jgi:thioredoxin-dependent peroxiredoxin
MLKEGDKAPAIKLETDSGDKFDLAKQKGKKVVVYFYPRADTPGCTIEAKEFNDAYAKIA